MKIICTTSNKYQHLIPVFTYLFNKYFPNNSCEIVGYENYHQLPDNITFHSMGVQGDVSEWSTDLRKYFEAQEDNWFLWMMEDTLLKCVDEALLDECCALMMPGVGRIDLTGDIQKREHVVTPGNIVYAHPQSRYRLSTQPSIWNKEFLLTYLKDGMTPWEMETQDPKNDGWHIVGLKYPPVSHNEGVNKRDIHKLNLNGFCDEDVEYINKLLL